jgi:hypothetical protein
MGGDVGLDRLTITKFERAGRPLGMTVQFHLSVAGVSARRRISSAKAMRSSSPSGPHTAHPPGIERGTQRHRIG